MARPTQNEQTTSNAAERDDSPNDERSGVRAEANSVHLERPDEQNHRCDEKQPTYRQQQVAESPHHHFSGLATNPAASSSALAT